MTDDRVGLVRAASVCLDEELLREASLYTSDVSETVEKLLGEFVIRERTRRQDKDAAERRTVEAFNTFHAEHGLLSDEFSGF